MSDFIYSNKSYPEGKLSGIIHSIYSTDKPEVIEFHGIWGTLAISKSLYKGFDPIETEKSVCFIIGAPVLFFTNNEFLGGEDSSTATKKIFNKWTEDNTFRWDEEVSGPFVAIMIDKERKELNIITDLMSFIPVYEARLGDEFIVGTHTDILAKASNNKDDFDFVSVADFILNSVVTFPYTFYNNIKQINPASKHKWEIEDGTYFTEFYWKPNEDNPYSTIDEAAIRLREGIEEYIHVITDSMSKIAFFISGGEDSRTILSLASKKCAKDTFIFLDDMNREGDIAKDVSDRLKTNFYMFRRDSTFYLDILKECSDLVGSGAQYKHVHTYGFHKSCGLNEYSAVFGGFLSDTLLKGYYIKKSKIHNRLPFLPSFNIPIQDKISIVSSDHVDEKIINEINNRRKRHFSWISNIRPNTTNEWFNLWPISMHLDIPNLYGNRRLFPSYEPFMANKVVKIAAAVPQTWKLNRKLFHRMAKPSLETTKKIPHSDGWRPYYSWIPNMFVYGFAWGKNKVLVKTGALKGNQGPWSDWDKLTKGDLWIQNVQEYTSETRNLLLSELFKEDLDNLLIGDKMSKTQKINLLQVLYQINQ